MKHHIFFARTVLVQNNNFEEAAQILNRILSKEGILKEIKLLQFSEKPSKKRRRLAVEKCKAIVQEETHRRIQFLRRKDRENPFPGC